LRFTISTFLQNIITCFGKFRLLFISNCILLFRHIYIRLLVTSFEWSRATRKSQWSTNPEHLPENYKGFSQWNAAYFIQKASLIGKNTETVIRTILQSRKYEVQAYRMCLGILKFTKKYSNKSLEKCCKQAISLNEQEYTFIKNTIPVITEDLGTAGFNHTQAAKKSSAPGGYVMSPRASSIDTLLTRSKNLADQERKEESH
jgi:hypothetical protein